MVVKHESVFATLFAKTNSSEGDIVRLAAVFIFHTYYVTRVNEAAFAVFIACLHSCKDCLVGIAAAKALVAERVVPVVRHEAVIVGGRQEICYSFSICFSSFSHLLSPLSFPLFRKNIAMYFVSASKESRPL